MLGVDGKCGERRPGAVTGHVVVLVLVCMTGWTRVGVSMAVTVRM